MTQGKLLIIGTPIGNLGDLSPRALDALKSADLVLCEDTRHTRKLLAHFGIDKPTQRFDDHTEDARGGTFADQIEAGATVALVSDAGMPVVSDPGFRLVRIAREMTKLHEELIRGTISEVVAQLESRAVKGEVTIVFAAAAPVVVEVTAEEVAAEFERLRDGGMRRNDAVKAVAEKFGLRKNEVYKMLLQEEQ